MVDSDFTDMVENYRSKVSHTPMRMEFGALQRTNRSRADTTDANGTFPRSNKGTLNKAKMCTETKTSTVGSAAMSR